MKSLTVIALLAALSAFAVSLLSFEVAVSVIFALGFALILAGDYARASRPLLAEAAVAAVPAPRSERFGLAA